MEKVIEIIETVGDNDEFSDEEDSLPKPATIKSIVVFPPNDVVETDEDADHENDCNQNRLTSAQVISNVEIVYEASPPQILNASDPKLTNSARKKKKARDWKSTKTFLKILPSLEEDDRKIEEVDENIMAIWESVFNNGIFNLLVDKSYKYAMQKNHSLNVSPQEMKVYIAILLLTGYLTPKNIQMFWEVKQDTYNQLVTSAMRRNRFLEIHQYLHTCGNLDLQENEKFAK